MSLYLTKSLSKTGKDASAFPICGAVFPAGAGFAWMGWTAMETGSNSPPKALPRASSSMNSFIGAAASFLKDAALVSMLAQVQKDLFSVGAQLADPGFKNQSRAKFQIPRERIEALEKEIDTFEAELPPLRQFILAGGGNS